MQALNSEESSNNNQRILRTWQITDSGLKEIKKVILSDSGEQVINMGAFLDKPVTAKEVEEGGGSGLRYGLSSMQGWRTEMEDAHDVQITVSNDAPFDKWSFFAVFDGHAGAQSAKVSAANLLKTILKTTEFEKLKAELKTTDGALNDEIRELIKEGIKRGFLQHDENIHQQSVHYDSGTTAVAAIFTPESVFFANLGDSRAIFKKKDGFIFGTEDHKPYNNKEKDRIIKAGGSVMLSRVNGGLAVSRAFGDFEYKNVPDLPSTEQLVSPEPDVYEIPRDGDNDEYIAIACDGIYDVLDNEALANLVDDRFKASNDLTVITSQVLDYALCKGSQDNMTMILINLRKGETADKEVAQREEEWVSSHIRPAVDEVVAELEQENESEAPCLEVVIQKVNQKSDVIKNSPYDDPTARCYTRYFITNILSKRSEKKK